jgi:hypothetical protein
MGVPPVIVKINSQIFSTSYLSLMENFWGVRANKSCILILSINFIGTLICRLVIVSISSHDVGENDLSN